MSACLLVGAPSPQSVRAAIGDSYGGENIERMAELILGPS
jgi:hypothetical protein